MPNLMMNGLIVFLLALIFCPTVAHASDSEMENDIGAPYIDSKAVKEQFNSITQADMDLLRTKKILWASRSFGLNTLGGLSQLAKEDAKKYQFVGTSSVGNSFYQKYDVFKAGGDLSLIPVNAFEQANIIHFMASYWPLTKRVEEVDTLLRMPPHNFSKVVDAVIIYFHTALPSTFEAYAEKMDALREDFPHIRFIYVTAGFMGPKMAKNNEQAHEFSELVRQRYRGKVPLYDMGAILSDDFRTGHVYCPEYSHDPADVHPNLPLGEAMLAKGLLLVLRDTFLMKSSGTVLPKTTLGKEINVERLPNTHPEAQAVRSILDLNGLKAKQVDAVSVVRKGHIVELYLQEGGVTEIPDSIGILTKLERLHVYGDRNLQYPLLTKISPAIGKCLKLQDLLLNDNDLTNLPVEITRLKLLTSLSIANNRLNQLSGPITAWAKRFDAKGLSSQLQPLP